MKKTAFILMAGIGLISFAPYANAKIEPIDIVRKYERIVYSSYEEAYEDGLKLQDAIDAFLANPDSDTLEKARGAWLESRKSYGRTETFRFYEGPIDFADGEGNEGPEARLNSWPVNEAYIDYVKGDPKAGIVNDEKVEITKEILSQKNQADDEVNVATGYHAIEFLLWGQDLSLDSAGQRPASDYASTPENERRRAYLKAVTDLLVDDLKFLVDSWVPGKDNFAAQFIQDDKALSKILSAMATLSGFELSAERMATALDSGDQEDEHSCFSDNTHNDFIYNQEGMMNVYMKSGLYVALKTRDRKLGEDLENQMFQTRKLLTELPYPIDREILNSPEGSPARTQMEKAIEALEKQAEMIKDAGKAFGVDVAIQE